MVSLHILQVTHRIRFVVLVYLLHALVAPGALSADSDEPSDRRPDVLVWAVSSSDFLTDPGEVLTVSLQITNLSASHVELEQALDLPDGWHAVVPLSRLSIRSRFSIIHYVAFNVPVSAPAGDYSLTYRVQGLQNRDIVDTEVIRVHVKRIAGLRFQLDNPPTMVVAGESVVAKPTLINDGNTPVKVKVKAKTSPGYPVTINPNVVEIPVRGQATLEVEIGTESQVTRPQHENVTLIAEEIGGGSDKLAARKTLPIETVPRADVRPQLFHQLPTTATARGYVESGTPGYQLEWQGSGSIDERGQHEVEFLLRGPDDAGSSSILGLREEYRFSFRTPYIDIMLGDQTYKLSKLTEHSRYGRGAGVTFHHGPVNVGAFYLEPRFSASTSPELGAWARGRLGQWLEIGVNALSRGETISDAATTFADTTLSLDGVLLPLPGNRLEFEFANSGDLREGHFDARALRLEGYGTLKEKFRYNLGLIHADPDFSGYLQDLRQARANLSYDIEDSVRLKALYQATRRNLDLDPEKGMALFEQRIELEGRCLNADGWCAGGGYQFTASQDLLPNSSRDTLESRLVGRLILAGEPLTLDAQMDVGLKSDRLQGQIGLVNATQFIGRYQLGPQRSLAAVGRLSYDSFEDSTLEDINKSLGLLVDWKFGAPLLVSGQYVRTSGAITSYQVDLKINYQLNKATLLGLRFQTNGQETTGQGRYALLAELSRNLGLPTARKTDTGAVRGRIYDADDPDQKGLEGVAVRMGGAVAITDSQGRFTLHSVSPGSYYLSVDPRTLGLDRILEQGSKDQQVVVHAGSITRVTLAAVHGATLKGSVRLFRDETGQTAGVLVGSGGAFVVGQGANESIAQTGNPLQGIVIKLTRGDEAIERYTNAQGEFLCSGIEPGSWQVSVLSLNLPEHHYVDNPEIVVDVASGETSTVDFKVLPRMRKIKLIDSGTVLPLTRLEVRGK